MWILFEGGYYSEVGTIIFTHMVTPCWRQVMEHKRMWTPVVDEELTCIAFSQHAQEFRHYQLPPLMILASFTLGASHSFAYHVALII